MTKLFAKKQFLTLKELEKFIGRPYVTLRKWVLAGKIHALTKATTKSIKYRVSVREAIRVKKMIESGEWF